MIDSGAAGPSTGRSIDPPAAGLEAHRRHARPQVVQLAFDRESPPRRCGGWRHAFSRAQRYIVSATVLRQRARPEINNPTFIIVKAADEFRDTTTTLN